MEISQFDRFRLSFDEPISSGFLSSGAWGHADQFDSFLSANGGLSKVPILDRTNVNNIKPNTLVRYRGVIRDMLGTQYLIGAYKGGSFWKIKNKLTVPMRPMDMSGDVKLWEHDLLYCVPVPGLNSWTQTPGAELRQPINTKQKQREDGASSTPSLQESQNKNKSIDMFRASNSDKDTLPCFVKMSNALETNYMLHEVYEFIGFFSFEEDELTNIPSYKGPQLHCIVHRRLGVDDFLQSLPTVCPNSMPIEDIREGLLNHLTTVLGNDRLAAQFLLLHLLSRVHTREGTVAVGKLSLNLTRFSKKIASIFGSRLNSALKNLLPFSQWIPLTSDYLNSVSITTKMELKKNRLVAERLFVADGSHFTFHETLDETLLPPGTLNSDASENKRLLKKLIELQQVEYEFKYYKEDMPTDVQLLVLSEEKSNMMPADIAFPFEPFSLGDVKTETLQLQAWRWYLATYKRLSYSLAPDILKVVEEDQAAARQADQSLGAEDLSRLLTMGRLMAISFGETSMSLEHWQMAKELEKLRKDRIDGVRSYASLLKTRRNF